MKCKCHPNSPFHWMHNKRPSIFATDPIFRPKGQAVDHSLTKEENVIAYKQFSIFLRANPLSKPSLNKHEL
jgi:hypothetical protein